MDHGRRKCQFIVLLVFFVAQSSPGRANSPASFCDRKGEDAIAAIPVRPDPRCVASDPKCATYGQDVAAVYKAYKSYMTSDTRQPDGKSKFPGEFNNPIFAEQLSTLQKGLEAQLNPANVAAVCKGQNYSAETCTVYQASLEKLKNKVNERQMKNPSYGDVIAAILILAGLSGRISAAEAPPPDGSRDQKRQ
jgi:hypothetical protein